ncbi:outer membrane protein [Vibrio sp. JCM 19236]|nr:outer membrane protein [Vibrio sp. JCM 19236]
MYHTSLSRLVVSSTLFLSSLSFAVEPLFPTPADAEPTFVDRAFDFVGADGGFDPDKGVDMSYIPSVFYNPEQEFGQVRLS